MLIILIFLFSSEVGMMYIRKADLGLGNSTKRVEGAIQITNFYRINQILFNIDMMWQKKRNVYRVAKGNLDFLKNMLLLKNPQFLPNQYETLSKKGTCECLILTKFCNGRVKIVDFLIKAYFWESLSSPSPLCIISNPG